MTDRGDRNRISDEISDAAQDWFLRLSAPDPSPADQAGFRAWRDADPRHRAAYDEVRATWRQIDDLEPAFAPRGLALRRQRPPATRRRRLGAAMACLAAACLLLFVFGPATTHLPARLLADYSTAVGEQRRITLPDGSTAYLNTDTAIDVAFADGRRLVKLLYGEALFEVRKDGRPFDVVALDGKARAVGTVFAVGVVADDVTVTVTEGVVQVTSPVSMPDGTGTTVKAGQQVSYRRGGAPGPVATLDANAETAWRWGAIQIRNRPLDEALAEIGRYHPGRIMLLGDTSRYAPVTARLALPDIDGGIDALAATHGLTVTRVTDYLLIIR